MTEHHTKQLLVCDLDDTLYDWVHYFVSSFYAMVDAAVETTGCDRELLLDDFRKVHVLHHDSEHPFSLLETETIRGLFPGESTLDVYARLNPAFHAFNSRRKQTLRLHKGVRDGLDFLTRAGVRLVAHTESKLYGVVDRLNRMDLTRYFARIYCRERPSSIHPNPEVAQTWLDKFPMTKVVELPLEQRKPNPLILSEICSFEGIPNHASAYVGDSIARDVMMAKEAGVFAIWAKYGAHHAQDEYEKLVRVSHWTKQDVAREKALREQAEGVRPDYIAENSFFEVAAAICSGENSLPST